MNKTAIILLMCLLVFSSCTVIPDKQIDETAPGTVDYTVDGTEKPFTDASETDETLLLETEESVESETNVPKTDIPETEAPETAASETNAPETDAPETDKPETDKPETDAPETTPVDDTPTEYIISTEGSIIYTVEYLSGAYSGYDFVDYEDKEKGDYYREKYPNKAYNENVNIELKFTAELVQTVYKADDKICISLKFTNIGEPFMFIDHHTGYFDSWLVHSDNPDYIFQNDYHLNGSNLPNTEPSEVLVKTGKYHMEDAIYTVSDDIPLGKYDLYISFDGYSLVVRKAIEIVEKPAVSDPKPIAPVDDTPAEYIISEDGSIIYTAKYYSGSYRGYDFVDYDDEKWGAFYKEMYPSKAYNENVNIELKFTAELDKTDYKAGDSFWISFEALNVGEPFMYIDHYAGYFDSQLVHSENSGYIFHSDYYFYGRDLPDADAFETLIETGEKRVDAIPYTVTEDTPLGKYDLYVYFGGYVLLVNDAFEIVE